MTRPVLPYATPSTGSADRGYATPILLSVVALAMWFGSVWLSTSHPPPSNNWLLLVAGIDALVGALVPIGLWLFGTRPNRWLIGWLFLLAAAGAANVALSHVAIPAGVVP